MKHPPSFLPFVFRAVDFAILSFTNQIALAQDTDVLIAPHGAVMAHLLYLRTAPVADVVEMKPPERRGGNYQFQNCGCWGMVIFKKSEDLLITANYFLYIQLHHRYKAINIKSN